MKNENFYQAELDKFQRMAAQWWDVHGPMAPLHEINPLRLSFITSQVDLSGKKALDIGCGGGILSESLAKSGADVSGIDMSQDVIDVAKLHLLESNLAINYECVSVEDYAENHAHQFDVITCMELLEHVPHPDKVINACVKLLKPDGTLFFSTINRNLKAYLFAIIGAEYLLHLLPRGTHHYAQFIRPSELDAWARKNNLCMQKLSGMSYNPITKKYSLTSDSDVNYLVSYRVSA